MVGKDYVHLPGNSSCSKSPLVGLKFAFDSKHELDIPTLFVIACQNFKRIQGMAMNNEAYSAYPSEAEVLLMEGCEVFILDV